MTRLHGSESRCSSDNKSRIFRISVLYVCTCRSCHAKVAVLLKLPDQGLLCLLMEI